MMAHTSRCAEATNPRCKCSCQHSLHGASSGYFSPTQVARAREPILAEVARADRWPAAATADPRADSDYVAALRLAKRDLDKQAAAASKLVAAGLINRDLTQELVDSAVNALMAHDGVTERKARNGAAKQLELHLLCTLFGMAHQAAVGLRDALTWTVGEFIEAAFLLPDRPRTVHAAVVRGVKDAFAEHVASEATEVFLQHAGVPSSDQLRLLAVMFCPNSDAHPEIRALEKEIAEEFATASAGEAIRAAQDSLDHSAANKESDRAKPE